MVIYNRSPEPEKRKKYATEQPIFGRLLRHVGLMGVSKKSLLAACPAICQCQHMTARGPHNLLGKSTYQPDRSWIALLQEPVSG